jgi:ATP-dependent helicase/nuclease subunit A
VRGRATRAAVRVADTNRSAHAEHDRDAEARERIATDLDTNLLVEAGAGSGKTTSLIERMLALIDRGTPVERIAAVTFTRKAANELRERFQMQLEARFAESAMNSDVRARLETALSDLERSFIGTIHSFCGRLLRERPLEVWLDPNFAELTDEEWVEARSEFWNRWVERLHVEQDPCLTELAAVGIDARGLFAAFKSMVDYPDVEFPIVETAAPDVAECRRKLDALLSRAEQMMPRTEPDDGWDKLMSLVRRLRFQSRIRPWKDVVWFCGAIDSITATNCDIVQKRWSSDKAGKLAAKELGADFVSLLDTDIAGVQRCWREHRYPTVIRVLRRAAAEFERERRATGQLNFGDLLSLAATLLRENGSARDELGARFRHLFVDEFQDTDPLQAEVCFLLASPSTEGADWRAVRPRPGSLFVVGDPKQSIYRFRRADIQIYALVRQRMTQLGAVLSLTRNFRSVGAIEALVNSHFSTVFPAEASDVQAPFSPMQTTRPAGPSDGIRRYVISYQGAENATKAYRADASAVASWIADRVAKGERVASDFLILTSRKSAIGYYARALSERNVAVSTTGADLPQEFELTELLAVLAAIADPENSVLVAAALEGLFFGMSPADLYRAREAGLQFAITHPPASVELPTALALAQLHEWWTLSQRAATDVLVECILSDTGLLAYAASQDLGDARAGALLHLVGALRGASLSGRSGISDAMDFLNTLLTLEAPDSPLRPGRTDAVRVMNLHKAKGLEAPVVVLAAPADESEFPPTFHVYRSEGGAATGAIVLEDDAGNVLAQPPHWDEMSAREERFQYAERDRLLYVAATRAKNELVVGQCERMLKDRTVPDSSRWRPLAGALEGLGTRISIEVTPAAGRAIVERRAEQLLADEAAAAERARMGERSGVVFTTVTQSAKYQRDEALRYDLGVATGLGAAWGRAVHRALEGLARGRTGPSLDEYVRAVAVGERLDDDDLARLGRLIDEIRHGDAWRQLASAGRVISEMSVMFVDRTAEHDVVTEGVIDAAAIDGAGWTIVDWKSDDVSAGEWAKRLPGYQSQVSRYAEILQSISSRPVAPRIERVRSTT